jgi:hypothetical protein
MRRLRQGDELGVSLARRCFGLRRAICIHAPSSERDFVPRNLWGVRADRFDLSQLMSGDCERRPVADREA